MEVANTSPLSEKCHSAAAMIACAAYYKYMAGERGDIDMDAYANLPLEG